MECALAVLRHSPENSAKRLRVKPDFGMCAFGPCLCQGIDIRMAQGFDRAAFSLGVHQ